MSFDTADAQVLYLLFYRMFHLPHFAEGMHAQVIFADQVNYIASLSRCFFLRMKFHAQQAYTEFMPFENYLAYGM